MRNSRNRLIASILPLILLANGSVWAATSTHNIRDHGAKGDGTTLDTNAINQAITACADAGGGQVRFPPGRYLSGTIKLKSKVTLFLETGATLVGTPELARYEAFQPPAGSFEATLSPTWHRALVLGVEVEDVAIEGPGTIDGNKVFDPKGEERMRGPHTVLFGQSHGITLRGVSIRDSANYAVMFEDCSNVEVSGVNIKGGWDGIHFRGWNEDKPCRDVTITDCQIFTGDDAIAGRYWENTLITGCTINSSCNGIRLIGPAKGLIIHNCLFYGPGKFPHRTTKRTNMLSGIILQPGAWDKTSGRLDDVLISDVTMRNVQSPVHLSVKEGNTCGSVTLERLSATGVYQAAISAESWSETPIDRVVMRDVSLEFSGGGTAEQAEKPVKSPPVDARPLPSWGLYARKVKELVLDDVRLRLAAPDARPAIRCENVGRLVLDDVRHDPRAGGGEGLVLEAVGEVVNSQTAP